MNELKLDGVIEVNSYTDCKNFNTIAVTLPKMIVYFSYRTIVAFKQDYKPVVVCQNVWSNSTGRHLGKIRDIYRVTKKEDFPIEQFKLLLGKAMEEVFK